MENSTSLMPLRHMLYGEMRYWVTDHIPGLRIITTRRLASTNLCGCYSLATNTILISTGMTYTQKRCTLVHELIHYQHGDIKGEHEMRTRALTARILIDPKQLKEEATMYDDWNQIADDLDITVSVLSDCALTRNELMA